MKTISEWKQGNLFTREWEDIFLCSDTVRVVAAFLEQMHAVFLRDEKLWVVGGGGKYWAAPGESMGVTCDPVMDGFAWPREDVDPCFDYMMLASMAQSCVGAAFNQRAGIELTRRDTGWDVAGVDLLGPYPVGQVAVVDADIVLRLDGGKVLVL